MYQNLCSILEKPSLYAKTEIPFWDDEHISREMLKAHLDPDFEGRAGNFRLLRNPCAGSGSWRPPVSIGG